MTADAWPGVDHDAVRSIIDDRDPELRNLRITQSYHRFTHEVGRRLGGRDIPWTGFAVWASKTAGLFIRRDWLPESVDRLLVRYGGATSAQIADVDRRLKEHVARGNRAVYAEIGPLFADLIDVLDAPAHRRESLAADCFDSLRRGPVQQGGQDPLRCAMRAYVEAASCTGEAERAQKILLANIWIGYQEQWRLQPEILGSLDSAMSLLPEPGQAWQRRIRDRIARHLRQVMTRYMIIQTPKSPMRLGRDIPALPCGNMFPRPLTRLDLAPLRNVVAQVDRTPDTTEGSAASDWASFDDRMNFLVDLFRSHQRVPALWAPPFSAAQVDALRRRELPPGRL